jgi:hypothetical protein
MAPKFTAGWYVTQGDPELMQYYDGRVWQDLFQPLPPGGNLQALAGWYPDPVLEGSSRWWTGDKWGVARYWASGQISVSDNAGQAVISLQKLGGVDTTVIAMLMAELKTWPPVRITSLITTASLVAAGTNLVAVVEWDRPS